MEIVVCIIVLLLALSLPMNIFLAISIYRNNKAAYMKMPTEFDPNNNNNSYSTGSGNSSGVGIGVSTNHHLYDNPLEYNRMSFDHRSDTDINNNNARDQFYPSSQTPASSLGYDENQLQSQLQSQTNQGTRPMRSTTSRTAGSRKLVL